MGIDAFVERWCPETVREGRGWNIGIESRTTHSLLCFELRIR
jgi:hypothetical protein